MNNALLLMTIDDMPMATDASVGLLRYAAKKEKTRKFSRQLTKSKEATIAHAS